MKDSLLEAHDQMMRIAEYSQNLYEYVLTKAKLVSGDEELIPSEIVYAILDGGNPIKVWREFRHLTQTQLAEMAGMSTPYLSQIETGKRTGTAEVLNSIAQALRVTLDEIIF
jgi:DNA-binding XRE family transcriptional regulator